MAREATITYEQVAAAAENMTLQGKKASARNVREVLGRGSMATVLTLFQQWQSGEIRHSQAIEVTLDPAIVRAITNQIAVQAQEATADTTTRLVDLQAEVDIVIAENERQASDIEAQAAELDTLQKLHSALVGRAHQLEADAARTEANLVAERRAAEGARVELAKAELRLEALPKIEAEIEKTRAELLQTRAHASDLHEAAAVATAKLEAEVLQRKGIEVQLGEAIRRGDEAAKRADASAEALVNERHVAQACQTKLEAAGREIDAAKEAVKHAHAGVKQSNEAANQARIEANKSNEAAAELRGQLSALKAK